jgi:hypothetical protein
MEGAKRNKLMELEVFRISSGSDSTSGIMYERTAGNKRKFLCYTLEDEYRALKKPGETRVPVGTYAIKLRTEGGMHEEYSRKFDFHIGMLWLQNVPQFEYVYIHIGNDDDDTEGCLLVGDQQNNNIIKKDGWVGRSTQAYSRIYQRIANHIADGGRVQITYVDFENIETK